MHLRHIILWDKANRDTKEQIKEMHNRLNQRNEKGDTLQNKTSFEALKEIDDGLNSYFSEKLHLKESKGDFEDKKFSGVDSELTSIYQYLETIGQSNTEYSINFERGTSFNKLQDYLRIQAKELQIQSSKLLASKLIKENPKLKSVAVQHYVEENDQESIEELKSTINSLNKTIDLKDNILF